ncbi:AraC family transcriptional regulator [Maribacter sp. TH_r10]|uniref:Helix-turn-helix domain-containing protein n=1 Tax=Maribacter luteus TaxID=2594478 RepID=A0A6I2MRX1_9FLAO|nr:MULTISPECIES: AraC family transcriptional regulator [Maribacter]MDV7139429.1 AraC family transcriptional regulator [Maribacter sp. TH_r10]MRX65597.1 helix-turn-helix domain-containing protein [Maribacter luteus]|tara:strand:+ start:2274 stop:3146 length:873 start_codon:yes stop_codon:yes gene_type:complete
MLKQKPTFEAIEPNFGHSFMYQKFDANTNNKVNKWHYHPEIELVYVNGGAGKRQIGSNLSYYTNGTLILVPSNLPHCGFTDELTGNRSETVIQMKMDFLGENFFNIPEMVKIQNLFEMAKGGIVFFGETKQRLGKKMEALEHLSNFERLLSILDILHGLGTTEEFRILNAHGYSLEADTKDNDRINIVFNYVKNNFKDEITLQEISDMVSMTIPSFCRYFKKITNKTFVQFVNEYRLVHASKLLAEQPLSITEVCFECGFNNFSHFNKSFKAFTGQNPSAYRNQLKTVLQ